MEVLSSVSTDAVLVFISGSSSCSLLSLLREEVHLSLQTELMEGQEVHLSLQTELMVGQEVLSLGLMNYASALCPLLGSRLIFVYKEVLSTVSTGEGGAPEWRRCAGAGSGPLLTRLMGE